MYVKGTRTLPLWFLTSLVIFSFSSLRHWIDLYSRLVSLWCFENYHREWPWYWLWKPLWITNPTLERVCDKAGMVSRLSRLSHLGLVKNLTRRGSFGVMSLTFGFYEYSRVLVDSERAFLPSIQYPVERPVCAVGPLHYRYSSTPLECKFAAADYTLLAGYFATLNFWYSNLSSFNLERVRTKGISEWKFPKLSSVQVLIKSGQILYFACSSFWTFNAVWFSHHVLLCRLLVFPFHCQDASLTRFGLRVGRVFFLAVGLGCSVVFSVDNLYRRLQSAWYDLW